MKGLVFIAAVFMALGAVRALAESPGTPCPARYTLSDIYNYLNCGTKATIAGHTLEPPSGAMVGDTQFKTLNQIYEDIEAIFDQCDVTASDVMPGKKFFCTQPGSWGLQTGAYVTPTPNLTPTPTPTKTWYQQYGPGPGGEDKVVQINGMYVAKWTNTTGTAFNMTKQWSPALSWVAGLSWLDKPSGWRLPTRAELASICASKADLGAYEISGPYDGGYYWTSESGCGEAGLSGAFSHGFRACDATCIDRTSAPIYVRAIRDAD